MKGMRGKVCGLSRTHDCDSAVTLWSATVTLYLTTRARNPHCNPRNPMPVCSVRGTPLINEVGVVEGYILPSQQIPNSNNNSSISSNRDPPRSRDPGKSNDHPPLYPNPDRMIVP